MGFAWKSLSSDNIDLQIVNENLKVSAKLNEAKLVTQKAKEATDISKEIVESVNEDVEEYNKLRTELIAEVQSIKSSYCVRKAEPLKQKIEEIEAKVVVSEETEKTLKKVQESLTDAENSLEKLEQEAKESIKEKETIIQKIENKTDISSWRGFPVSLVLISPSSERVEENKGAKEKWRYYLQSA